MEDVMTTLTERIRREMDAERRDDLRAMNERIARTDELIHRLKRIRHFLAEQRRSLLLKLDKQFARAPLEELVGEQIDRLLVAITAAPLNDDGEVSDYAASSAQPLPRRQMRVDDFDADFYGAA
jgi:hypothetical protein